MSSFAQINSVNLNGPDVGGAIKVVPKVAKTAKFSILLPVNTQPNIQSTFESDFQGLKISNQTDDVDGDKNDRSSNEFDHFSSSADSEVDDEEESNPHFKSIISIDSIMDERVSPFSINQKNKILQSLFERFPTSKVSYLSLQDRQQYSQRKDTKKTAVIEESTDESSSDLKEVTKLIPITSLSSLTYGELKDIYPIYTIFLILISENLLPSPGSAKFYDLGSGSGRVVLAASLLYPFKQLIGIEILESLYQVSKNFQNTFLEEYYNNSEYYTTLIDYSDLIGRYNQKQKEIQHKARRKARKEARKASSLESEEDTNKQVESPAPAQPVEPVKAEDCNSINHPSQNIFFYHDSIEILTNIDWTDGDVIFVNSTCFDRVLMSKISEIAARLKPGTVIITLTHMLDSEANYDLAKELRLPMSW